MRLQSIIKYASRFLEPTRVFIALMLAAVLYFLPLNSKPEFIEQNGRILEIAQVHPVLQSIYPQGIYATCGDGGTGTNCHTGCCSAGQCVVCPQDEDPPSPPTISANLNCSDWGDNGWCKGSLSIDLSAADPQGQAVVISGAVNGNNFACPSGATSCSIPLSGEGTGSVSYQVNSATGLSAAGSLGYQIDLSSPDLDTSVSGAAGTNGWYRSDVTLGVSASDATSGIASITASINGGGATSVGGSLTFSDGEYSVLIVARDNAGHVTQDTQIIKVDTITPSLSFTSSGTNGKNGWYVSSASAAATAGDSGSGLASIEASVDGGGWTVSDSISLGDGVHTYQFRATDVAGNKTETPTQTALVDTIAPSISMSQGTSLGEKVLYEIEDYGSGLSIFRAVIEDDDEAYQKVVWSGDISGSYIADDILWDGKFADGTKAGIGEYMVTLKITDAAGNKAIKATFVTVGLLDLLDDIPAFSPPISSTSEEEEDVTPSEVVSAPLSFGGIQTTTNAGEFVSTTTTVSGITIPTTNIPIDPNILWGAAATAMVGATLADWQRQREEEERRKAAERADEDRRANTEKRKAQKAAETAVRERWAEQAKTVAAGGKALYAPQKVEPPMPKGLSPEAQAAYLHGGGAASSWINKNANTLQAQYAADLAKQKAQEQERLNAIAAARWTGAATIAQAQQAAQEQAAFDHRMDEHTGEQDKVDAWKVQQANAARWAGLATIAQKKEIAKKAQEQAAFDHRMDEHTGEQDVVDSWYAEQNHFGEEQLKQPKPLWQKIGDFVSDRSEDIISVIQANEGRKLLRNIKFAPLKENKVSVSATTKEGTRRDYTNALKQAEERYVFPAGRYNPLTVASRTTESLVRGSLSKTSILTASMLAIGTNLYDFGKDAKSPEDFANKTIKKQEFWVSTAVDLGISLVVGAAAALVIGGLIVGAAALGAATAPLVLTVAATAGAGIIIGSLLESSGITKNLKTTTNMLIDIAQYYITGDM